VTTGAAFLDLTQPAPPIEPSVVAEVQREVIATLLEAEKRQQPGAASKHHVVFHIDVPYTHGFERDLVLPGGEISLRKTRIIRDRNRRISAVVASVSATGRESAKARALSSVTALCALLTLSEGHRYERSSLHWSRFRPPLQFLAAPDLEDDRLYPLRLKWPDLEASVPVAEKIDWLWAAYKKLDAKEAAAFSPALFAHYGATTNKSDGATLSVIGYTAALSALALPFKQKCAGSLTCSVCGELSWRHDSAGEVAAILSLITKVCKVEKPEILKEIEATLKRVYGTQRSAFVHGAQFRHEEFGQGIGLPAALPTSDDVVQRVFRYSEDLASLGRLTRRVLLEWLGMASGAKLPHALFGIEPDRFLVKLLHSMQIASPGPAVIGFAGRPGG